jgi:hypothetical protein
MAAPRGRADHDDRLALVQEDGIGVNGFWKKLAGTILIEIAAYLEMGKTDKNLRLYIEMNLYMANVSIIKKKLTLY